MSSAKRKSFSIAEKAAILLRLQNGDLNSTLAKEYGVPHSTISSIKKNKQRIETLLHTNDPKRKRVRSSTHKQVENALLQWTKLQSDQRISVTGPMLLERANFFGTHLNIPDFKCSVSWINRFKVRHNIVNGKIACEPPVQKSADSEWLYKVWPDLRAQFNDDQIYSANEAELFYELTEKQKCDVDKHTGGKSTERKLTVMVAANIHGTIKKNLLIIGKSTIENLPVPVDYETNRRASMTPEIVTKWLRTWDDYLTQREDKILLLIKKSPVHVFISDLKSVTLVFLPSSMTSVLKPFKGITQALQTNFQKNLALKITKDTSDDNKSPNITLLDTIMMTNDAWNNVTPITIKNCFKQAGFVKENEGCTSNVEDLEQDNITTSVVEMLKEEYVKHDSVTDEDVQSSDEDVITDVNIKTEPPDENDNDNDVKKERFSAPSISEALIAAEVLSVFVDVNFDDDNLKSMMSRVHAAVRDTYYRTKDNHN